MTHKEILAATHFLMCSPGRFEINRGERFSKYSRSMRGTPRFPREAVFSIYPAAGDK